MPTDIWPTVRAERRSLLADLQALPAERLEAPSLCGQWTVRDVLAHMTATARITPASFFPKLAGSGFSFAKMQAKDIAREKGASGAETLAHFESVIDSTKRPPGPPPTMLGETLVHAEDVRRALDLTHDYPADAMQTVADFYKKSNLILGTKRRIAGVRLQATDTGWSYGAGPEASGPMMSVLMAMTGRKAALGELTGPGVAVLESRP